jgi:hypothetical protein
MGTLPAGRGKKTPTEVDENPRLGGLHLSESTSAATIAPRGIDTEGARRVLRGHRRERAASGCRSAAFAGHHRRAALHDRGVRLPPAARGLRVRVVLTEFVGLPDPFL